MVSEKLRRQFAELSAAPYGADAETSYTSTTQLVRGMLLSLEQLDGLHQLELKALTRWRHQHFQRDNLILIVFISLIAMASYVAINFIMGRVNTLVMNQSNLANELELKNSELERFEYTVSHELKNPLVTIKGFIGILGKNLQRAELAQIEGSIDRINHAADEMDLLMDGLLDLSRTGRVINAPETGSLVGLAARAADRLRDKIEVRGITLKIDPKMPSYWGDRMRLQEVFENLIENAVKFMGQ